MKHDNLTLTEEDTQLLKENPIKYYLKHIGNQKIMGELKRDNRKLYDKVNRLHYIRSFANHDPIWKCPECGEHINIDEFGEEYCPICGLITRSHTYYNAGIQIDLPYGLKL